MSRRKNAGKGEVGLMNIQDRRVGTIHRWWSDRVENGGKIDGSEDHNVGREGSMHR